MTELTPGKLVESKYTTKIVYLQIIRETSRFL